MPIKYESPRAMPNRVYIPPGTVSALADPKIQLLMKESALSRFMSGKRGLSMESLDLLLAYLGLEVVERKERRK